MKRTRNELFESAQVLDYIRGGSFGSAVDKKNEERNYLRVLKCWMYICGGSFGSSGSAVDKKNEK